MRFLLGTDEAGYGPNLGPLVVAASAWQVPSGLRPENLYDALAEVICRRPAADGDPRLIIADSKQLYQAGGSLAPLERAVLALLSLIGRSAACWKDCWTSVDARHDDHWHAIPWHDGYDEPLPLDVTIEELASLSRHVAEGCRMRDVRPVDLTAAVIAPGRFNAEVAACGNKAEVLSLTTLRLARRLIESLPEGDVVVVCDKHGGRAYYAALVQHVFECEQIVVRQETAELGVYDVRASGRSIEFRFLAKGECMLPTALASMTAKYLRELAMRPFNAFWQRQVPGLRPTCGYPTDARRFLEDIRPAQKRLKISNCDLWRER